MTPQTLTGLTAGRWLGLLFAGHSHFHKNVPNVAKFIPKCTKILDWEADSTPKYIKIPAQEGHL